ncbi:MAG TPA: hypothetical protein ENJ26_00655 [Rhodobacteraceae bacterium]|nr:hypothetical protein [Paracoccaceae bacterium]
MRGELAPLVLFFLAMALLIPPWLMFASSLRKIQRVEHASRKSLFLFSLTFSGFAMAFNAFYILIVLLRPGPVVIAADAGFVISLTLAWVTFWTRYVINILVRGRERVQYRV